MGTLRHVRRGGRAEWRYVHEENAHDISLEQRLPVILPRAVLETASECTAVYLRLQPHSTGSYVSGKTKQDPLCYSHKCDQTRHESTHAGDNEHSMAEPLASASLGGGHVHVLKGACSHGGDGDCDCEKRGGLRGKDWPDEDVECGLSTVAGGHGVRLSTSAGRGVVVVCECRPPASKVAPIVEDGPCARARRAACDR
jgi:hypothetical protein